MFFMAMGVIVASVGGIVIAAVTIIGGTMYLIEIEKES